MCRSSPFFDANGNALNSPTLIEGAPATVLGYFRTRTHHMISLDAAVVELGSADTFQQYAGIVESLDLDNNHFSLRDNNDDRFTVSFENMSKFFGMNGKLLTVESLLLGSKVKVDGVLHRADSLIKAAAVFIDTQAPVTEITTRLSGTIALLHGHMSGFEIVDETLSNTCVKLGAESNIYLLTLTDGSFSSEAVDITALQTSQYIEVYGLMNESSGCFMANNLLAEAP